MKTNKLLLAVVFITTLILFSVSCTDQSCDVRPDPVTLDLTQPTSLSKIETLGRVLFYDTHLSVNNAISCATCHKQTIGFSDNVAFSRGFENRLTSRNSLPIQNLFMFSSTTKLFWDGRESQLQTMVLKPIVNHVEMGMDDEDALVARVSNVPYYPDLFEEIWGANFQITSSTIAYALGSFIENLSSFNSRFDQAQQNENALSAIEKQGKQLFFEKYNCNSCHNLQGGGYGGGGGGVTQFINIGLDINYSDPGRQNVSNDPADAGKFKIPQLRNVALTAPYMHDGRFSSLDETLNHYSNKIKNHANLDSRLKGQDGLPLQLNISDQEKTALIAFLNALTDFSLITNPDLSNPFQ